MKFRDLLLLLEDSGDEPVYGDTGGMESGETNMPHGSGYPNTKYDIDKVIWLGYIGGVTPQEVKKYNEKYARQLKEYIKTKVPWLVPYEGYSYDYLSTVGDISNFVANASNRFRYWLNTDLSLDVFRDNPELDKQRKQKIDDIVKSYPDALAQLDKLNEYLEYVDKDSPENPENQSNYPLYVSLYDKTRQLGGHEEGGWWYDVNNLVESKKVNDFKQAENAARFLYNKLQNLDLDGQPQIILEKTSGAEDTSKNPKPVYESKFSKVAQKILTYAEYKPGQQMANFSFIPSDHDVDQNGRYELDQEDALSGRMKPAPDDLIYTNIPHFFYQKNHPYRIYCSDPTVIEFVEKLNSNADDAFNDDELSGNYWEIIYNFFNEYFND